MRCANPLLIRLCALRLRPTNLSVSRQGPSLCRSTSFRPYSVNQVSPNEQTEGSFEDDATAVTSIEDVQSTSSEAVEILPKWSSFSDRIDPMILESLRKTFKYERMTKVQQSIVEMMPMQNDLLVRSKTGTGKTLAFLIPALQRALEHFNRLGLTGTALKTYGNRNASVLIISPTRELANQIATEARRLVTVDGSNMKALCVVGGDSKRAQLKLMRRERNDFVVGTPGRLLDLLENDPEFASLMPGIQTLIMDEADTLLEMGFRKELERIIDFVPPKRQTYMFSATVSRDIQRVAQLYLSPDHKFLNTVGKDDQDVHTRIKQEYILRPSTEHIRVVLSLIISQQLKDPNAKVIVFLPTTKMTMFYASIFKVLRRLYPNPAFQQFDIHAQRTQESRTKVSKAFREANAGSVLFTTDVSARGVDYPGVTQVIQVGAAASRDLYIHRIGRTGRAGKNGEGVLILQPFEEQFLHTLGRDIPLVEADFPDSEIALGLPQQKVFDLMYKITPADLIDETFVSLAGAFLPRAKDFGQRKGDMLRDLEAWFRDFAGEKATLPRLSPMLTAEGRERERDRDGRRDRRGGRGNSFSRSPDREWRPSRPSERLLDGRRRKDFSRSVQEQHLDPFQGRRGPKRD